MTIPLLESVCVTRHGVFFVWRYGLLPRYPSVLRLVQFNCPDLLLGDLNNYVEERSRRNNFTRTDAIVEAITKYLDELDVLAPAAPIPVSSERKAN